jgi:hypothetical protein
MLSPDDKRRIEEAERYRAHICRQLGPVETTSFINRLAKLAVKVFVWRYVLALAAGLVGLPKLTVRRQII